MVGIKQMRCYWECLREHIGNMRETQWELDKNTLGTYQRPKEPTSFKNLLKKKLSPLKPFHWLT